MIFPFKVTKFCTNEVHYSGAVLCEVILRVGKLLADKTTSEDLLIPQPYLCNNFIEKLTKFLHKVSIHNSGEV